MSGESFRLVAGLLACFVLHACAADDGANADSAAYPAELGRARALIGPGWPVDTNYRVTTSGEVYLGNLQSQAEALEQQLRRGPNESLLVHVARIQFFRFQVGGRLEHAELARSLLETAYVTGHDPSVAIAYSEVLSGFHEFQLANEVLDEAQANGADPATLAAVRRTITRALGRSDTEPAAELAGLSTPIELVNEAGERVERGQPDAASRLLKQAQDGYQGTAPYLLAWIHVQQGIVFLRYRDYASARLFFAAAHERFPQFAAATEHLAETELALGNHARAARLYRSVAEQTGNPEFYFQLSRAERALGDVAAASQHETQAHDGYQDLLNRYPLMYADHAARYYMETGDTATALKLAEMNIEARQDIRARMLLMRVKLQTNAINAACQEYRTIRELGFAPPELADLQQSCSEPSSD